MPFKIHGKEITESQVAACLKAMTGSFVSGDVVNAAIVAGVPEFEIPQGRIHREPIAMRLADRLLQQQKKLGRIAFKAGKWISVDGVAS